MAWFIGQSLLVIISAFLLGLLVGWLLWARRRTESSTADGSKAAAVAAVEPVVKAEPEVKAEPVVKAEPEHEPEVVAAPKKAPAKKAAVKKAVPKQAEPELEPAAVAPDDDLQRIEGIGPKMSAALHAAGIRTYAQLAATDQEGLRAAIESAGLKFAPALLTWAQQAQLLTDGDEDGFADLTRRLVAGRDTGRS